MKKMWKKVFILLCAYLSSIAFAVIGGVIWYKNEDEEIKKTLKSTLIVLLIFTGISALLSVYSNIGGLWPNYYASAAYEVYSVFNNLVNIAKIVTFAVLILREIFLNQNVETSCEKTLNSNNATNKNSDESNNDNDLKESSVISNSVNNNADK